MERDEGKDEELRGTNCKTPLAMEKFQKRAKGNAGTAGSRREKREGEMMTAREGTLLQRYSGGKQRRSARTHCKAD